MIDVICDEFIYLQELSEYQNSNAGPLEAIASEKRSPSFSGMFQYQIFVNIFQIIAHDLNLAHVLSQNKTPDDDERDVANARQCS